MHVRALHHEALADCTGFARALACAVAGGAAHVWNLGAGEWERRLGTVLPPVKAE